MVNLDDLLNRIKRCEMCIDSKSLEEIKELTKLLVSDRLPVNEKVKQKLEKIVKEIVERQGNKNEAIKHGGFWGECKYNFKEYKVEDIKCMKVKEDFFGIYRCSTAIISTFLTTYYILFNKNQDRNLKECINKSLKFNGIFYISFCACWLGIDAGWGSYSENVLLVHLLDIFTTGLTPQYAATYYKEDERILPILSFFVKAYKYCRSIRNRCRENHKYGKYLNKVKKFLIDGKLPDELFYIDKKTKNFLFTLRKFIREYMDKNEIEIEISSYRSVTCEECKKFLPILSEQFRRANFNPYSFEEPNFLKEEEKWLAAD
jgi:hypothetical protein